MRQIIRGIRNLITYAPLIWRDRDWDHSYLLEMLIFKLRHMEAAFASDAAWTQDADEIAAQIKLCHEALARAWEDDYRADELAAHREKWGRSCCPKCGGLFCDCFPVYEKDGESIISHEMVHEYPGAHGDEEQQQQASDERIAIYQRQEDDKNADLRDAFSLMAKRILWWWD